MWSFRVITLQFGLHSLIVAAADYLSNCKNISAVHDLLARCQCTQLYVPNANCMRQMLAHKSLVLTVLVALGLTQASWCMTVVTSLSALYWLTQRRPSKLTSVRREAGVHVPCIALAAQPFKCETAMITLQFAIMSGREKKVLADGRGIFCCNKWTVHRLRTPCIWIPFK